ncbi:MAG: hypothetical protein AB7T49_19285 [Oligoflexales bacterium]
MPSGRFSSLVHCLLIATVLNIDSVSLACASCGSGGDDPLILYPNERLKVFVGLSEARDFRNIDPAGSEVTAGGPTAKQTLTSAIGYGISTRSFVTATQPYVRNVRGDASRSSFGDPSLAGRYSIFLQSFDDPYLPQVQILYGYKHALSRSIHESKELKTLLDVYGTGFSEIRGGLDIWFGITPIKPGISQTFSLPQKRSFDGIEYRPGLISRTTLSLGYGWSDSCKVTVGANRESREHLKVDGIKQDSSTQLNNSEFASVDIMTNSNNSWRLSASRQAAFGKNYNTSRSNNFGIAYMHSF